MTEATRASNGAGTSPLLEVRNVKKHFVVRRGAGGKNRRTVYAVDGVSFELNEGETFGLVGESGCGKSTLARVLAGLYTPTDGTILLRGEDVNAPGSRKRLRGQLQMVFQNPASSLDPRRRVADSVAEPLIGTIKKAGRLAAAAEMLERVGLDPELGDRFPQQLSGGQQQRACIARALVADPSLVVLDEALSSLDVSLQGQIMNLLHDLQHQFGCAYIFITHDLATAFQLSTRIAIMYLGEVVELLPADAFQEGTLHPYSNALVEAVLVPDPEVQRNRKHSLLVGEVPSATDPPPGCRFHTRCPYVQDRCRSERPPLIEHRPSHWAACHFADKLPAPTESVTTPRR